MGERGNILGWHGEVNKATVFFCKLNGPVWLAGAVLDGSLDFRTLPAYPPARRCCRRPSRLVSFHIHTSTVRAQAQAQVRSASSTSFFFFFIQETPSPFLSMLLPPS
jgi:hypothetical protein